jgi:hypothetical protein
MQATTSEKHAFCSVASIGRGRWFWALWDSYDTLCAAAPVAEGTAASKAEAVDQLKASAAAKGIVLPVRERGKGAGTLDLFARLATHYLKVRNARRRLKKPARGKGASPREYVYRHHYYVPEYPEDAAGWVTQRHRILRRTRKRIYVARREELEDGRQLVDYRDDEIELVDTVILDRQRLEAGEEIRRRDWWEGPWTLNPHPPARESPRRDLPADCPPWLEDSLAVLALSWPCTAEDVTAAYRRACLDHHPDRGGSTETMQGVNDAHEGLRKYFGVNGKEG